MKVAIATDDYISVTGHVGRCEGFLVVTIENGEVKETEKRENNYTNHATSGHQERGHRHQHGVEHKTGHERLAEGL